MWKEFVFINKQNIAVIVNNVKYSAMSDLQARHFFQSLQYEHNDNYPNIFKKKNVID